jgi:hypothetical protein
MAQRPRLPRPFCLTPARPAPAPPPPRPRPAPLPTSQMQGKERALDLGRCLRVFGFTALVFGPYQVRRLAGARPELASGGGGCGCCAGHAAQLEKLPPVVFA